MRAAVIFGLGTSPADLRPFQTDSRTEWLEGLPAASSDADAILIFGGDGTIHRHLTALVRLQLPVLIVPVGSGNDFARALKLRGVEDLRATLAAQTAMAAFTLATISWLDDPSLNLDEHLDRALSGLKALFTENDV